MDSFCIAEAVLRPMGEYQGPLEKDDVDRVTAFASDKVDALLNIAATLRDQIEGIGSSFDYSRYKNHVEHDDTLPKFFQTGGGRRPKSKVREFLRTFLPAVEYMMSESWDYGFWDDDGKFIKVAPSIKDRVDVPKARWFIDEDGKVESGSRERRRFHDGGTKLPMDDQFDALNQPGKLAFLITKSFYPEVTIGGKTTKSKNKDGDFHAVLHPKGNHPIRYDLIPKQIMELRSKRRKEKRVDDLVGTLGREALWERHWSQKPKLRIEDEYLRRNFPIKA